MLILVLLLVSCKTVSRETEVPIRTEIKIVEKEIPVPMPQDSASMYALFECDSTNQVIMRQLEEQKTQDVNTTTSFIDGILRYKFKTVRDTVYVHKTDSFVYAEKPIRIKETVEVNKLKSWQKLLIWSGVLAWVILIGGIVFNITKRY